MKRKTALLLALLIPAIVALTGTGYLLAQGKNANKTTAMDSNGHVLTAQWAEYEKMQKADRPQKEAEILKGIRDEAMRRHLPADFYDAGKQYFQVERRRNWKLNDSLRTEFQGLVERFNEPIVTYTWMGEFAGKSTEERWEYVQRTLDAFARGQHPEFYRNLGAYLAGALKEFISNDREYVLWDLLRSRQMSFEEPEKDEVYQLLKEDVAGRYPAEATLRYYIANRLPAENAEKQPVRQKALEALAADPAMGAVAFWPRQDLLQLRFSELDRKGGQSEDYKTLLKDCKDYLSDQARLSGAEARIAKGCMTAKILVETLNEKNLFVSVREDSLVVSFRNLSQADLKWYQGKNALAGKGQTVRNPAGSFYALDRVTLPLPVLDDGEYRAEVVNGKVSSSASYVRQTLSLAHRSEAYGYTVYVADYLSGKPLDQCKLILRKGDRIVSEQSLKLDGFTPVPSEMQKQLAGDRRVYYTLQAEMTGEDGRVRRSPEVSIGYFSQPFHQTQETTQCNVYLDRGAFNPGDTLQFKGVLFKGDLTESLAVLPGTSLDVKLFNTQGEEIAKQTLKTNDFGSIAGSFVLPEGQRGGLFHLQVLKGKTLLGSRSFRVDEFVLPTFTLRFEPVDKLFLVGEEAEVRGRIESYSGHSLSGAQVSAQVLRYGEVVSEQTIQPDGDGSFKLCFTPGQPGYHQVTVKVVDATGETLDFATSVYVADEVRVDLNVLDAADGSFVPADEPVQGGYHRRYRPYREQSARYLVTGDTLRVELTARNTQGESVPITLSYSLQSGSGAVVDSASVLSGTVVEIPLPKGGLYDLQVAAKVPGKEIGDDKRCRVLKVGASDKVLDAPVRRFFLTEGEEIRPGGKIRIRMGTADGEEWAVATVFGRAREVLATRKIHLAGEMGKKGSVETLEWTYDPTWPEAVRVQVFYFKYGETVEYDHEFYRVRTTLDLPLSFSSFTDRTMPGTEYTFSLKTRPGVEAVAAVYDKSLDAFGSNFWPTVALNRFSPAYVACSSVNGVVTGQDPFRTGPQFEPPLPASQPGKIVGLVVDPYGEPVVGASVIVKGSTKGAVTDMDGKFVLEVPAGTQLVISSIGYKEANVTAMSVMRVTLEEDEQVLEDVVVVGYGYAAGALRTMARGIATKSAARADGIAMDAVAEEMAAPMAANSVMMMSMDEGGAADVPDVPVRERFANALTFQPFLQSDASGNLSFTFRTSDKLSTYHVSVFAHDPDMRNAYAHQEMVVTTPVKLSLVEPEYLYAGDRYKLKVSVTNNAGRDLKDGRVALKLFASEDRSSAAFRTLMGKLPLLKDGATESVDYEIEADAALLEAGVLGIQAVYESEGISDGLFLTVPVHPAVLTLTEAHSAVLLAGADREALIARLRAAFVNTSGADIPVEEVSILDMVRAALPTKVEPEGEDVLSLSEAWYVRLVAGSLGVSFEPEMPTAKILERIRACQNADGGFAWFEGMKSSPVITATLLERFAKLSDLGLLEGGASAHYALAGKAVRFLDRNQFDYEWPFWCGGLSVDKYLYIRSFYRGVPFEVKGSGTVFNKRMKEFKKYVSEYLVPKKERGLTGAILAKARRLRTLQNLLSGTDGIDLAKAWGVNFGAESKMQKSLNADILSLLEYAVDHRDGGKYYPNAVMPWRGLLESEAYAHSLLCDLLSGLSKVVSVPAAQKLEASDVADGIRLWLMLQKETQHWDTDPAFTDAIHSILSGTEDVLQTRVLLLKKTYEKPFAEIAAVGNGFTVSRRFLRARAVEEKYNNRTEEQNRQVLEWQEIAPGEAVQVGDRIAVEYRIWNAENRSFVKLSAPREASLRPVDQLSGRYGWGIRPLRIDGLWSFQPQGYRDVKADHTDYYFDTYPEENTTIREEFFVTQAGLFSAPVVSIESLYAPHYRANDGARAPLESR